MPTRILVVGGGGREHALAWKLGSEPGVNEVVVAPGSDAIALEPRVRREAIELTDVGGLVDLARRRSIELAVIGPEISLALGTADELVEAGVPTFGPTLAAARIETSKGFCREVAVAAGVPMARGALFDRESEAIDTARAFAVTDHQIVVKEDGLAGGKGVTVCGSLEEAEATIVDLFEKTHGPIIVEERLEGVEASVIALCDGVRAVALPAARDHKRLRDGDAGPNTGGMGAYTPLPDLTAADTESIVQRFHVPVLAELARRGMPFRGALYAGLMLTADGPRLLEFNARFGDPETQVMLPRLGSALGPLLLAAAQGKLPADAPRLTTGRQAAVGIVLASAGYPAPPSTGDRIDGLDAAEVAEAIVFHAATRRADDGTWATTGGRVLTVVGRGPDLEAARDRAERAADAISWPGMQRRRDIGRAQQSVPA